MNKGKLSVVYHLYTPFDNLHTPGIDEWDEVDEEFTGNNLSWSIRSLWEGLEKGCKNIKIIDDGHPCNFLHFYYDFTNGEDTITLDVSVDDQVWEKRDLVSCEERVKMALNCELGQRWWIHHISFSTGEVFDVDKFSFQLDSEFASIAEKFIVSAFGESK